MECSTNVFESSGIEIIGDALPDLSPIKANSRTTDSLKTGTLCSVHEVSYCLLEESGFDNNVTHDWPSRISVLIFYSQVSIACQFVLEKTIRLNNLQFVICSQ